VKKVTLLTLTFILALLFSAVAGQLTVIVEADPYMWEGYVPAGPDTIPPKISIFSPNSNTTYNVNNVTLAFNVTEPTGPTVSSPKITQIYYCADWLENNVTIYNGDGRRSELSIEKNLKGIPEGNHNITIVAGYEWDYITGTDWYVHYWYVLFMHGSFSVNFVVDTTPPKVSVLSAENKTYNTPNVPLNFTLNETASQITYSLDGEENVTIMGNFTLTDLSNGNYNVTVYAIDEAGNTGTSETMYFSIDIPEPFPTAYRMGIVAVIVLILLGAIVYILKHKP
jgi:hypothetical protein